MAEHVDVDVDVDVDVSSLCGCVALEVKRKGRKIETEKAGLRCLSLIHI